MLYEQILTPEYYFFDNQTFCAHYDGNDQIFTG